jgi:hypothetical protein
MEQEKSHQQSRHRHWHDPFILLVVSTIAVVLSLTPSRQASLSTAPNNVHHPLHPPHILPPRTRRNLSEHTHPPLANITLRDYLLHPDGFHLAMAPSFFGFYGYFGALAGIEEELFGGLDNHLQRHSSLLIEHSILKGVAGASAGAMAAILLAAGVSPLHAAEFCATIKLRDFLDFPAWFSFLKGDKFEAIMNDFLLKASPMTRQRDSASSAASTCGLQLEDSLIPVAVSAFDLQSVQGKLLTQGSMARAARASACFPFLFQPVGWIDRISGDNFVFVDGGLSDTSGLAGLKETIGTSTADNHRVINMVVGDFHLQSVPGPSSLPAGLTSSNVLSISIQNLPQCGPWAMENGPLAVEAARIAMKQSLDLPLHLGEEDGHFELHIDAACFIPTSLGP